MGEAKRQNLLGFGFGFEGIREIVMKIPQGKVTTYKTFLAAPLENEHS